MSLLKKALLLAVLGVSLYTAIPTSAKADHNPYWRNHWGWYNNTYRPYYHRSYYYSPGYYGGYYGGGYPYGYYGGRGYYGGGYYGGGSVNVGPLNIGWW